MKVTDLIVGDLVYVVRGYDKHLTIEKIKGIIADKDEPYPVTLSTNETVSLNDISPIPLTEEILTKNGFEKQGDLYQYHINAGDGYTRIDIIDLQDGVWSYSIDVYDKFADTLKVHHDDNCFLKLHQLQHLLQLCDIEKEIEL